MKKSKVELKVDRCIECFRLDDRVPGKTICAECFIKLFPEKIEEIVIPVKPKIDEGELERLRQEKEVLILLENAPYGLRLVDIPERLHAAAYYLHSRQKIKKPRKQDRYFALNYAPEESKYKKQARSA